jgi:hypothetical protein
VARMLAQVLGRGAAAAPVALARQAAACGA